MSQQKSSKGPVTVSELTLDAEAIKARRVPMEEAEVRLPRSGSFICHFCSKRFKSETLFMKHHCDQKRKQQELHSPLGQAALSYYRAWMRAKGFRDQPASAFVDSKFYRAFIKFAQLVQDASIAQPEKYVQLMVEGTIQPALWCNPAAYRIYLNWYDHQQDPLEQVQASISVLLDLAEKEGVDYRTIFKHLGSQRALQLITQRKLSPWFLFHSATFSALLKSLEKEERHAFHQRLNAQLWVDKLKEAGEVREQIKLIVRELGL